mmetsp:Transcript_65811/g.206113  ORF Transcript_65811/g.206113 Transcript_65811/m.206113 type:complete len:258 (+) Transcript_65811:1096-1869(+)
MPGVHGGRQIRRRGGGFATGSSRCERGRGWCPEGWRGHLELAAGGLWLADACATAPLRGRAPTLADAVAAGRARDLASRRARDGAPTHARADAAGRPRGLAAGSVHHLVPVRSRGLADGCARGLTTRRARGLAKGCRGSFAGGPARGRTAGRTRCPAAIRSQLLARKCAGSLTRGRPRSPAGGHAAGLAVGQFGSHTHSIRGSQRSTVTPVDPCRQSNPRCRGSACGVGCRSGIAATAIRQQCQPPVGYSCFAAAHM